MAQVCKQSYFLSFYDSLIIDTQVKIFIGMQDRVNIDKHDSFHKLHRLILLYSFFTLMRIFSLV